MGTGQYCGNVHTVNCSTIIISLGFASNSQAKASELLDNLKAMFPLYHMNSNSHHLVSKVEKGLICKKYNYILFACPWAK